jgi:hypothetical protein
MKTPLDEALFRLLDAHPDWISCLALADAELLLRRRQGATLRELADLTGLTSGAVRARLYGRGHGRVRSGGVLGKLRGLAMRERLAKNG